MGLSTPKEAAEAMNISIATITRCVQRGAPVHRWGSTGRRYRIDVDEFVRWMEAQGGNKPEPVPACATVEKLAARRRAMMRRI